MLLNAKLRSPSAEHGMTRFPASSTASVRASADNDRLTHPVLGASRQHVTAVTPAVDSLSISRSAGSESPVMSDFSEGTRIHDPLIRQEVAPSGLQDIYRHECPLEMLGVRRMMESDVELHAAFTASASLLTERGRGCGRGVGRWWS